jgi:lactam utilization protein B
MSFSSEFYTDLSYSDEGHLLITREHAPVDPADTAARSLRAIREGLTRSVGGKNMKVRADSICIHSETASPSPWRCGRRSRHIRPRPETSAPAEPVG